MIEHFWKNIPGYFTWPAFYRYVARELHPGGRFVEVGVYAGQSAAFLGVELVNIGKDATIDLVDTFDGGVEHTLKWLEPVKAVIGEAHVGKSVDIARRYADRSVDGVFIDADHSFEAVRDDIAAWRPKVKPGGILAGHDFCVEFSGVIKAVTEAFERVEVWRGVNDGGDAKMIGNWYPVWMAWR